MPASGTETGGPGSLQERPELEADGREERPNEEASGWKCPSPKEDIRTRVTPSVLSRSLDQGCLRIAKGKHGIISVDSEKKALNNVPYDF